MKVSEIHPAVIEAEARIRLHVRETWVEPSPWLAELTGAEVWLKLENLQHTGSFKVRGAVNKLLCLDGAERARGVVAASTGNHGAAVAYGAGKLGVGCLVFVPESASPAKLKTIERLGAEIRPIAGDPVVAEREARRHAAEHGQAYISPYNDPDVVAGQGTVAAELARQCPELDAVVVALGGGGLISGIAGYLKAIRPEVRIIGCSPENSKVMIESVRAGRILDLPSQPTLSDGTAGGVEEGAVTFELCRELVDEYVTVTEEEIRAAFKGFLAEHRQLIEGAAAMAVGALVGAERRCDGTRVAVVLCGANADLSTLLPVAAW